MRELVERARLIRFMELLGARARGPGAVYLCGGATAVLLGWRDATVDIDLRLDPEPAGAFAELPRLKQELSLSIELASPHDFLPPLPGWRERSRWIGRYGAIDFYHYDFTSQALAKLERGHSKDLIDVRRILDLGLASPGALWEALAAVQPELHRYPAIEPAALRAKVERFLEGYDAAE